MVSEGDPKQSPPDFGLSLEGSTSDDHTIEGPYINPDHPIDTIDQDSGHLPSQTEIAQPEEIDTSIHVKEPKVSIVEVEESIDTVSTEIEQPEPSEGPTEDKPYAKLKNSSSSEVNSGKDSKEKKLPKGYSIKKLNLQLPLSPNESICSIAAHQSNLYIGTTHSQLFHLYLFEDAEDYIAISQLTIGNGNKSKVTKILLLTDVELCLILCNEIIYTYLLPELSPCSVGKIRDVQDILTLSQVKSPKVKNKLDKIVAFTGTKIRLLQFSKDVIKLLKDIPYTGSVTGISSAAGTLANYSNICFVANGKNYDVVDIQQTRRIPLSEFNPSKIQYEDKDREVKPLIVRFTAEDKPEKPEEYLLSICSDSTSSMALFVNAEGDVIRGTLIWFEEGCPTGGLSVEWPFVVGLFWNDHDKTERICISSLESLETVFVDEVSSFFDGIFSTFNDVSVKKVEPAFSVLDVELLNLLQIVSFIDRCPVQSSKFYKHASIAFVGSDSFAYLECRSSLSSELESFLLRLQDEISGKELNNYCKTIKQLADKNDKIWPIYIASLLLAGQLEEVKLLFLSQDAKKKFDPRLLLSWFDGFVENTADFWKEFVVPKYVLDLLAFRRENTNINFCKWVIEETYKRREFYGEDINSQIRKYIYTLCGKSTSALIDLAESEKELWIAQNQTSDELLSYFEKNQNFLILIQLFRLKQREGNCFKQWDHLIVELGLEILAGRKPLNHSDEEYQKKSPFNLVEVIFNQLRDRVDEEKYFAKNLLELLKLLPDEGLALLKKHKGGKFLSCNKAILAELSKSIKLDHKFSSLKIEYSEQAFINSLMTKTDYIAQAEDLAIELLNYMNEESFDDEFENLSILYETYQVENSLSDSTWPKLTWIEFLHLHGNHSECKELSQAYLKLYELLLLFKGSKSKLTIEFNREGPVSQYLTQMNGNDSQIKSLLNLKDFSLAEWVALTGVYPIPRKSVYLGSSLAKLQIKEPVLNETITKNIRIILDFYLGVDDETAKYTAVNHVFTDLVSDFVPVSELIQFIPDDFPIWCIRSFAALKFTSLGQEQSESAIRKVLARQDAKFSALLLLDFQNRYADFLQ